MACREEDEKKKEGGGIKLSKVWKTLRASLVFVLLTLAFFTSATYSTPPLKKPKSVLDDETVYALLDASGKVKKKIVVDWLRVEGEGLVEIVDKGEVTQVESLKDEKKPEIKGKNIVWEVKVNGLKDFYYRADTKKELPLEVEISYFLDGMEVSPKEVAGKGGHLKINIRVKNKLKKKVVVSYLSEDNVSYKQSEEEVYVPLMAVVNMDLKAGKFSNIETEDEMLSVSGETMKYTWMLFPQGEEEVSIEMDGRDIEIDPIIISVFPQMPSSPEIEMEEEFEEMKEGLEELSQLPAAHIEVLNGVIENLDVSQFDELSEAAEELSLLGEGIKETREGIDGLVSLLEGQIEILDGIIQGIDTSKFENISQLTTGIEGILQGLQLAKNGVDGIITLLESQINLLNEIKASNDNLLILAQDRANFYSGDTTLTQLVDGLTAQGEMITTLTSGGNVPGQGYLPGLNDTESNLEDTSNALTDLINNLQVITQQAEALNEVPGAFASLKDSLIALRDGGEFNGVQMPGLKSTLEGLRGVSSGLQEMEKGFSGIDSELEEFEQIPEVMTELRGTLVALRDGGKFMGQFLPGITTTEEALEETVSGLGEGLEEMRKGEAIKDAMEKEAQNYDTFLGKPDGAKGRVRFILKTEGVEK
jgi:putative membrane protein